ncbi:MAG: JAB domain-containing protein [Dehalococcoidia bacterium]|nr:JAB domain-containing protein [Dehalococcoidia bacterium]
MTRERLPVHRSSARARLRDSAWLGTAPTARVYPIQPERIHIAGLGDEADTFTTACSTGRAKYDWTRLNICVSRAKGKRAAALPSLRGGRHVAQFVRDAYPLFAEATQERLMVIPADGHNRPIGFAIVALGGRGETFVDNALVLRTCLLVDARTFVIVHNHPSGLVTPSNDDHQLTEALAKAAKSVGLAFLDHVIVAPADAQGTQGHYSYADSGAMPVVRS